VIQIIKSESVGIGPNSFFTKGTTIQTTMSIFMGKRYSVLVFGRLNKALVQISSMIKSVKSHFDGKYDIMVDFDMQADPIYGARQVFRWSFGDDFDSYSELAVLFAPHLNKKQIGLHLSNYWEGGCSCCYDCCGHWFTNVWTHKAKQFGPFHLVFFGHGRNV
jgi:hypothetical protein